MGQAHRYLVKNPGGFFLTKTGEWVANIWGGHHTATQAEAEDFMATVFFDGDATVVKAFLISRPLDAPEDVV